MFSHDWPLPYPSLVIAVLSHEVIILVATTGSEMTIGPFPCCVMPNFIQDDDSFLDNLKDELLRLKYYHKDNDLYQFHQVCLSVCMCVRISGYLLVCTIFCHVLKSLTALLQYLDHWY